jgi:hypothetical protein
MLFCRTTPEDLDGEPETEKSHTDFIRTKFNGDPLGTDAGSPMGFCMICIV